MTHPVFHATLRRSLKLARLSIAFALSLPLVLRLFSSESQAAAPEGRYETTDDTVLDTETGLTWQRAVPPDSYAFATAQTYCNELSLANHNDWRLPNMKELQTLVDDSIAFPGPTINSTAFPSTPNTGFWSSTALAGAASGAWNVDFYGASSSVRGVNVVLRVRCVR